jgi:putative isomerase
MTAYTELKARLARGWNTWNTRSVLSHVLLPQGFALNLAIKEYMGGGYLKEALIGRFGENEERITPGPRAYDDSYTELTLEWMTLKLRIQSATDGDDLVLLVTPLANQRKPATLAVEAGILWNRAGVVRRDGDVLIGDTPGGTIHVYATAPGIVEPYIAAQGPYLALALDGPVGVSTRKSRAVAEIESIIAARKAEREAYIAQFGALAEVYAPVMTCLAWDTVYDPLKDRVISPVSRSWSIGWGGYVLFDWDTYFASLLAAIDNKELAYANAIEITREQTPRGFIPNFAAASGCTSHDRSQPPVGSMTVLMLYRRYGERWLLDEVFDTLLTWNRWWVKHRMHDGLLCWGSDPFEQITGNYWEYTGVGERFGAALESGLDNSPMYDDVAFDPETHLLKLVDVGLSAMYVMDCRALAEIADALGKATEAAELRERAETVAVNMAKLWDEEAGIYKNLHTDTGALSPRLSPTNFYPLLGAVPTQEQAERMIAEHFYNPREFWGEWIMPSISREDPGYPDNSYWRGRIWAPMNFLVYLGMRRYDLPQAIADLVAKSRALLLKEWREHGHVHENYNGDTGEGCDRGNSDRFYHWGGLLGLIAFIDAGYFDTAQ